MQIVLVSPKWHQMVNSYPPLGLGYLAAVLEREGHTVSIHDLGLDPKSTLEDDVRRIAAETPDLIGITAMTNNYQSAVELIEQLCETIACPIVMGGPHATLFPDQVLTQAQVDYVVLGEGEETLRELVQSLANQGARPALDSLQAIRGLAFEIEDRVIQTPPRPLIRDLDALPFPARHLFELDRYPLFANNGERMVTLLSSRGCPFNCSYCFKGIVGRTYRQRSPGNVLAEIEHLVERYGYRHFYFVDDLFTLDQKRLTALAEGIIAAGLDIRWQCLARVDRVNPELLKLMYRAGCREIHYGIESGVPEMLDRIGKQITLEGVRQAVAWTAAAGISAKGYFMLGLPGDTEETIERTIRFAAELELDQAMFSITTPFPGTRLWEELIAQKPETAFGQDFAAAYYYTTNCEELSTPFLNVSEVPDDRLAELVVEARKRFDEAKRRRKYAAKLGPGFGNLLYDLSNIPIVRRIGHRILRSPLLQRWSALRGFADYDWRREFAEKWD